MGSTTERGKQEYRAEGFDQEEKEIFHRDEDNTQAGEESSERPGVPGPEEAEISIPGRSHPGAGESQRQAEVRADQVRGVCSQIDQNNIPEGMQEFLSSVDEQ